MFAAVEGLQKGHLQNGDARSPPTIGPYVAPTMGPCVVASKSASRSTISEAEPSPRPTTDHQLVERVDKTLREFQSVWRADHKEVQEIMTQFREEQVMLKVLLKGLDEKLEHTIQHGKRYPLPEPEDTAEFRSLLLNHLKDLHEQHSNNVKSHIEVTLDQKHEELLRMIRVPGQLSGRLSGGAVATPHNQTPTTVFDTSDHRQKNSVTTPSKTSKEKDNWYATGLNRGLKKYTRRDAFVGHLCCGCIHRDSEPDSFLARLLRSHAFEFISTVLVVSNTFLVGYETNARISLILKKPPEAPPAWFDHADKVFTYIFLAELIFRIIALHSWFFCGDEWRWNLIDSFIVIASVIQHALETVQNVSFLRILRIVRLVRVLRIVRVVRFFRELRKMVFSILSCLVSLGWAFLLLLLIMFMFSMFFLQAIIGYVDKEYEDKGYIDEDFRLSCVKWFADTEQTMFSMILSVSGGTDWLDVVTPLSEISKVYRFAFMFYIVFVVFGVLNVLTGVFLESAGEFMDRDLQIQAEMARMDKFVTEMHVFFKELDETHTGAVDFDTFNRCMQDEKVQAYLASHQLDCTDAEQLYRLLDANHSESINLSDFIIGLAWLKGSAKSIDVVLLMMEMLDVREQMRVVTEHLHLPLTDNGPNRNILHFGPPGPGQHLDHEDIEDEVNV